MGTFQSIFSTHLSERATLFHPTDGHISIHSVSTTLTLVFEVVLILRIHSSVNCLTSYNNGLQKAHGILGVCGFPSSGGRGDVNCFIDRMASPQHSHEYGLDSQLLDRCVVAMLFLLSRSDDESWQVGWSWESSFLLHLPSR